ncbi:MAG: aromatic-ring-hydroxylating dioxygenase subunit beta [Deltaproteobacteria bacterium]|nr:aromatic-ring-hydroxylating dioxygenase subunit beta [Deltaproteobacteria bacterium]
MSERDISRYALRAEIEELYGDYAAALDDGDLDRWPECFTDPCLYKIIPRDNYERGLPLALVLCESRGMLRDRVEALRRSTVFAPRYLRHIIGPLRLVDIAGEVIEAHANYVVLETPLDEPTRVLNTGRYLDKIARFDGRLRLRQRICVFDSLLVPGSLVYPI